MKIIIGLGNPGKEYQATRHNIGFMIMDKLRESYNFPGFEFNKKFDADVSAGNAHVRSTDDKIILVKPQTFMNNSGQSIRAILDFYKLTPEDIIVIHDDIDLPLGEYKIAANSGSAGHNGVEDIISKIGTKNFTRVRIGTANADLRSKIDPTDFVLQSFSEEEIKKMTSILEKITEEIQGLI